MFECRTFAPGETAESKTTYFYGRESKFEQAWDAVAVYLLNDSRWKDDPIVLKNIAGVDKMIGDKDFETWSPFGGSLFASSQVNPVSFEIKMIR